MAFLGRTGNAASLTFCWFVVFFRDARMARRTCRSVRRTASATKSTRTTVRGSSASVGVRRTAAKSVPCRSRPATATPSPTRTDSSR